MRGLRSWLPRASFANVVSVLALFVALGGTGYAAVVLPAGSVGTSQLQKDAVTSGKVKDGSLKAVDFRSGQIPAGPAGAKGAAGATGAVGPAGPTGTAGSPGSALAFARVLANGTLDATHSKNVARSKVTAQAGYYCVDLAPGISASSVVASLEGSGPGEITASLVTDDFTSCLPAVDTYDIVVVTAGATGTLTSRTFNVVAN